MKRCAYLRDAVARAPQSGADETQSGACAAALGGPAEALRLCDELLAARPTISS